MDSGLPSISVIDHVIEAESIPSSLFADIEAVLMARNDREVVSAAAGAVFSLVGQAVVTFTVYSDVEAAYVVYDNYRDGQFWEWQVGCPVAKGSLTNLMARVRRPVERHVPAEASDPWFLDYPDFYGVPLLFEDGMLTRAMTVGVRVGLGMPSGPLIYYLRLVGGFCEKAFQRLAQVKHAVDAGQTLEREYILQELHDTAIQDIFACELGLMRVADALSGPPGLDTCVEELRVELATCLAYAQEANANMRKILNERSARRWNDFTLVSALVEDEIAQHAGLSGIPVVPVVNGDVEVGGNLARTVRMFVHECLCNVRKHAKADNAVVISTVKGDVLSLCVEDDGVGFEPVSRQTRAQTVSGVPHFGLANLEEAIGLVGGQVFFESALGEGCAVRARIRLGEM